MPKTLRLGFIGAGGMTKAHTDAMAGFTDVAFAAFCDVKKAKAAALAEQFGAEAFSDPAKMFAAMDLDAVWVNLPPFAHGEAEFAALAADFLQVWLTAEISDLPGSDDANAPEDGFPPVGSLLRPRL